ncbi:MAG TPA: slipin family protein, partial [Planctomycetes bacterium]|nr:slipin family protein [Planctomycetota bacterium]
MRKFGFWFEAVVRDEERAYLYRDGRFLRLLQPGRFVAFDPMHRLAAETVKVMRAEITPERALLLQKTHRPVAEQNFEIVHVGPNEVAIVSFDGEPKHLLLPNTTRAFWRTLTRVDVERIDTSTEMRIAKRHLDQLDTTRAGSGVVQAVVEAHEAGLLMIDGE